MKGEYMVNKQLPRAGKSPRAIRYILFFSTLLSASIAFSNDLSGYWKHAKHNVWIEMEKSTGIVVRNDRFPERVGRTFLTDITINKNKQNARYGQIYIEKLEDYKKVEISLPETDQMLITGKMGFMSRTAKWMRIDKVPAL